MKIGKLIVPMALMLGAGLSAQDETFTLKAQVLNSQGDLREITQNSFGYGAELGWDFGKSEAFAWQLNASFFVIRRKETSAFETFDAKAWTLGVDARYKVGSTPVTVFTGPLVALWDVTGLKPTAGGSGPYGERTPKFGWRAGVEYAINNKWSVNASYTLTEFKTTIGVLPSRVDPINPSFVKLGVGYRF